MSHCTSITCPQGTCDGCLHGKLNCQDPNCAPYCKGCTLPKHHDEAGFYVWFIILFCLIIIILALLMAYGPRMVVYHNGDVSKPVEVKTYADWANEPIFG